MASYNPNNLSPDELSCPICFEEFSNLSSSENVPKLLLCLHTFCLGCIRSLVRSNKTIQCSICRTEHTDVSPQELFDNYVIMEYVRKQQEESDARLARKHSEHLMRVATATNKAICAAVVPPATDQRPATYQQLAANGSVKDNSNADILKRKLADNPDGLQPAAKRSRTDGAAAPAPVRCVCGMFEDQIRRYLVRKPMTTTEILQKLKSKKTGRGSKQLVDIIAFMLKKINPHKQHVKGKMYLSLKTLNG